jgi:hypothetical protein
VRSEGKRLAEEITAISLQGDESRLDTLGKCQFSIRTSAGEKGTYCVYATRKSRNCANCMATYILWHFSSCLRAFSSCFVSISLTYVCVGRKKATRNSSFFTVIDGSSSGRLNLVDERLLRLYRLRWLRAASPRTTTRLQRFMASQSDVLCDKGENLEMLIKKRSTELTANA